MTLRKKTIFFMALIFVTLIAIIFLVLQVTVVRRFQQYEREEMAQEVNRGLSVLAGDLENLDETLKDWSRWDDSYAFLEDGSEDYIHSNLTYESMHNIRINVILFVRPSGGLLYGAAYDFASGEEVALPEALLRHLASSDGLVSHPAGEGGSMGIIMIDKAPLLVVARPVLTSMGKGPSRGTLIMGSYLDGERIERLGRMVALDLSVLPVDDPGVPQPALDAPDGSADAEPVFIQPLGGSRIAGYALLNDVYGNPALVMRVDAERDLYRHGQMFLRYLILILFGVVVVFAGAVLIVLERSVLKPLARFSDRVSEIDTEHDLTQRLGVEGKDELARLAGAIDTMLDHLQHAQDERRGSEEALRESARQLRDFLTIAAHELRHPVTVIVGYAETLASHLDKVPKELLPEITAAIRSSAGRLNGIMGDLLDVSRVEQGAYTAKRKDTLLGPLLERVLEEMRTRGLENPIAVHTGKAASRVEVDPEGFVRVMVILLDNAVKFSPPGSPVEIHVERDGEGTLVSVLDRGIGVAPEAAGKVFEPAFQVGEVLHHSIPGMGMGLYIAGEIVEAHGGRIWCEAREGGGSAFRFELKA